MPASYLSDTGSFLGSGYVFYERLLQDSENYDRPLLKHIYNGVNEKIKSIIKDDNRKKVRSDAAAQLRAMAAAEKAKEQMVIKTQLGLDIDYNLNDAASVKRFLEDLSACFGLREHHLRNIERITNRNWNQKMISISKFIVTYGGEGYYNRKMKEKFSDENVLNSLKQAILTKNTNNLLQVIQKMFRDILEETVNKMFNSRVFKGQDTDIMLDKAYIDILEKLNNDPNYKTAFYGELEKMLNVEQAIKDAQNALLTIPDFDKAIEEATKTATIGGDNVGVIQGAMEELTIEALVKAFSGITMTTEGEMQVTFKPDGGKRGETGRKTDVYITLGINMGVIDSSLSHKQISRQTAIDDAKNLAEKLKKFQGGFVVNENAKNYTLGENFRGFSAGAFSGAGGLNFLRELYGRLGKGDQALQVFNGIKNMGKDTVGEHNSQLLQILKDSLGADIAYALFDDYDAIGVVKNSGAQQLHILDLNGTQISLSFYLNLLAEAFEQAAEHLEEDAHELVRITIKPAPAKYADIDYSDYTSGMWEEQRQYSDANSIIDAHFLLHFEKIIEKYLK